MKGKQCNKITIRQGRHLLCIERTFLPIPFQAHGGGKGILEERYSQTTGRREKESCSKSIYFSTNAM